MSKQKGQHNKDLFQGWITKMKSKDSPNWLDYWHGGALSPKKIANELGFDSSAFKKSRNPDLFNMLQELKQELAVEGIHDQGIKVNILKVKATRTENVVDQDIKDSAKVRDLKKINERLQKENAKLTAEITKLSEFKEVLVDMGLWK